MVPLAPIVPLAPMTPLAPMAPGGSHGKPLQALSAALPSPHKRSALILVRRPPCRLGLLPAMAKSPQVALRPSSHLLPFLAWAAYDGRNDVKLPGAGHHLHHHTGSRIYLHAAPHLEFTDQQLLPLNAPSIPTRCTTSIPQSDNPRCSNPSPFLSLAFVCPWPHPRRQALEIAAWVVKYALRACAFSTLAVTRCSARLA